MTRDNIRARAARRQNTEGRPENEIANNVNVSHFRYLTRTRRSEEVCEKKCTATDRENNFAHLLENKTS